MATLEDDRPPRSGSIGPDDVDFKTVKNTRIQDDDTDELTENNADASLLKQWQLKYYEAVIFLQEGENNDKFYTHPKDRSALLAYEVAHNMWFRLLDLVAAIMLLVLALFERPAVTFFSLSVGIHGSLEMLCLLILSLELGVRFKWFGWKAYFKHKRTVIKMFAVFIMLIESIVVLVRQNNHFRVMRCIRPIFLIHSYYCRGVRRISRQVLQSLPPIVDMIMLLLFFMLIFSILGFYLFSHVPNDVYFNNLETSFISLFVLLTTANFPDVMMPACSANMFYSIFFIIYLSLELYFLMNLLLAVVYDKFSNLEKAKFQELFFHKREGCQHAFRLLVNKQSSNKIELKHFLGMMSRYHPSKSKRDTYLIFKSLNTSKTGSLSLEEFYSIYDMVNLKWKLKYSDQIWSSSFKPPFDKIFRVFNKLVNFKWFDYFIYLVIGANFLWILIETIYLSANAVDLQGYDFTESWTSIAIVSIFSVEVIIKLLGKGPLEYFTTGWDVFDFLVTVVGVIGVLGVRFESSFYYVMVLRPFGLLRLFKVKKRYRDVLGTLFVLFNKLTSLAIVIILVYYFFAIIGMEIFLGVNLKDCCKNTTVSDYYKYDNNSQGYHYLNNFDNILISGLTLFELTVVNSCLIIMEGYANKVSEWTRVYFMLFYIVMMVVMNIIVAFVLESFLFRIQYRRQMKLADMDDDRVFKVEVSLSEEELNMSESPVGNLTSHHIIMQNQSTLERQYSQPDLGVYVFKGERSRTKDDFSLKMYGDEVKEWLTEKERERQDCIQKKMELRVVRPGPNSINPKNVSASTKVIC